MSFCQQNGQRDAISSAGEMLIVYETKCLTVRSRETLDIDNLLSENTLYTFFSRCRKCGETRPLRGEESEDRIGSSGD